MRETKVEHTVILRSLEEATKNLGLRSFAEVASAQDDKLIIINSTA